MKSAALDDLIALLSRLPGIGERTATRLAFHLLRTQPSYRESLARTLHRLSEIVFCKSCRTVSDKAVCNICDSHVRNRKQICVVEKASDIYAIERLNSYRGTYFVLHGLLSPMEGITPDDLNLSQLAERVEKDEVEEIILALNPTVEGDVTSAYLVRQFSKPGRSLSRLASGLPVGSELEYADQMTLGKAFEGRLTIR